LGAKAANKEELLEMITHGAEKIVNSAEKFVLTLFVAMSKVLNVIL
jgi:hypothetical protein